MMRTIIFILSFLLFGPAALAESIYTKIDVDACQVVGKDEQGGRWACPGWGGYPVEFSEGDLRESLFFGHLGTWAKKSHWESFGQFNHVAGTVEWIVEGKVAKAAITRFIIQNSNADGEVDAALRGEVLVVYKVGQKGEGEACAVGYVDARANSNPNELARKVAATEVNGFACRFNEPGWHGIKGPTAGNASRSFEEMALE